MLKFTRALDKIWSVIAAADKYLTSEQPWSGGTPRPNNNAVEPYCG